MSVAQLKPKIPGPALLELRFRTFEHGLMVQAIDPTTGQAAAVEVLKEMRQWLDTMGYAPVLGLNGVWQKL